MGDEIRYGNFTFDGFEVDPMRRILLRDGEQVSLGSKAIDLLLALMERRGEVVSKSDLLDIVWPGQYVEENNLTVHIAALRKALGESKGAHKYVVTVPGKGYSFVGASEAPETAQIFIETREIQRIVIDEEINDGEPTEPSTSARLTASNGSRGIVYASALVVLLAFGSLVWLGSSSKPAETTSFKISKLTASGQVTTASITPDGKYAVFAQTDKDGEGLWLRHIATGSQNQILRSQAIRFVGLSVSPDSNFIFATVFSPAFSDPQLWRIPLLGGAVEHIRGITTGATVSLSPDGGRMAFTQSRNAIKETHLDIANVDGSNRTTILVAKNEQRSFPNFDTKPVQWSPDGSEIAVVVEEKTSDGRTLAGVLLVNVANKTERYLADKRWNYVSSIAWLDDANVVLTAADLNQGQIWKVSRDGSIVEQLANDLNDYGRLTAGGRYLLAVEEDTISHLNLVEFDYNGDKKSSREIVTESGLISTVGWSSDAIIYSSWASGRPEIWRIGSDGSDKTQLTVNSNVSFGMTVSPVDRSIVFGATENGLHSIYICDADGKNMRRLIDGTEDVRPNFTPDGKAVIFQRGLNNKQITLWRYDLDKAEPVQLTATHALFPTVSPDGEKLAYYLMDTQVDNIWRIAFINPVTGEFAGKTDLPQGTPERFMRWHPNGRSITQSTLISDQISLVGISLDGKQASKTISLDKGELQWFEWSRTGTKLAVSHSTKTRDIVLIEPSN